MTKRKTVKKKKTSTSRSVSKSNAEKDQQLDKILVQNFVSLQKVMVNLSTKFDSLTAQISKLLDLFEISAKTLAQKEFNLEKGGEDTKKILTKIDDLLEQNKIIAKGLTLMHKNSENPYEEEVEENEMPPQKGMPPATAQSSSVDINQYQRSISSEAPRKFNKLPRE